MRYPNTFAEIDLDNLAHNYHEMKRISGEKNVICIIKADAYGHGAVACAKKLQKEGADYFAVASVDEAEELRINGITSPILILGYVPLERVDELIENDITAGVYSIMFARALSEASRKLGRPVKVHIKINTGMNRLGFTGTENAIEKILQISKMEGIRIEGVFTHYATADEEDLSYAREQLKKFTAVVEGIKREGITPEYIHISNSPATLVFNSDIGNTVRPGLCLYGISPLEELPAGVELRPVMTFCSQVANTFTLKKGESVGYARKYIADSDRVIATVCCGYADGYLRILSNKADVFIGGKRAPIRGNICMDMLMADVTDIEGVRPGDRVELFGEHIPAKELADLAMTIPYEITCELSKRVKRIEIEK